MGPRAFTTSCSAARERSREVMGNPPDPTSRFRCPAPSPVETDPRSSRRSAVPPPFGRWRRFEPMRAAMMRQALERIAAEPGLSKDVLEQVSKSLA